MHVERSNLLTVQSYYSSQKKNSEDYGDEMDTNRFEECWPDELLPNTEPESVVLMDSVAYQGHRCELMPSTACKKEDVEQWLLAKNTWFPGDSLKWELLQEGNIVNNEYTSCDDEIQEQRCVTMSDHLQTSAKSILN